MARISLIEEAEHPELADIIGRIKAGRRGGLLNVYKLLLHNPALAQTWFDHNGAVRWKTELTGRLREIVIIRIAHLNGVDYVLAQHVPGLAVAEGLSLAECDALVDWRATALFDASERAALAYAEAMTLEHLGARRGVRRRAATFQRPPDRRAFGAHRHLHHA